MPVRSSIFATIPTLAVEVTLQPIERFGFDASILFSDILVVPHALGRDVRFEEGRGPLLTPISVAEIAALDGDVFHVNLEPVYETVRRLRAKLPDETTLIGFCGAPWTVATYMIAGHGTPYQAPARLFAYREPEAFLQLLKVLADHSAAYLIRQIEAGADVVQIFDSWSGVLDDASFDQFCVWPVAEIVSSRPGLSILMSDHRLSEGRGRAAGAPIARETRCRRVWGSTGRCRWQQRRTCSARVPSRAISIPCASWLAARPYPMASRRS